MIKVENLTFTYPHADHPVIKKMNFQVNDGELLGFLGPSGAGKSTTQKILIGLLRGYSGEITVLSKDLEHWKNDYYEHIGVSFELPNHFLKLSALENLIYFSRLYNNKTQSPKDVLAWVGLEKDGDMPVSQFSKGMKNRLSVARALLNRPRLLFLDEPTAGLDPINARRIKELILEQKRAGRTIFLTTHDMTVADELCDRVAFIVDGKIKALNNPREFKLRYGKALVRVEYLSKGEPVSVEYPLNDLGKNKKFNELLQNHSIQTIHSQEATLESVFIQETGRQLS